MEFGSPNERGDTTIVTMGDGALVRLRPALQQLLQRIHARKNRRAPDQASFLVGAFVDPTKVTRFPSDIHGG